MSERVYTIKLNAQTLGTNAGDILCVYASSSMAFKVREIRLGQTASVTIGNLAVDLKTLPATVTTGSGGSSVTPDPVNPSDVAATITARMLDGIAGGAAASSSGTVIHRPDVYNPINGYLYQPLSPDDMIIIKPTWAFSFSLVTIPSPSQLSYGYMTVEELF